MKTAKHIFKLSNLLFPHFCRLHTKYYSESGKGYPLTGESNAAGIWNKEAHLSQRGRATVSIWS